MSDAPLFLHVATYQSRTGAEADFNAVLDLHSTGVIGTHHADASQFEAELQREAVA